MYRSDRSRRPRYKFVRFLSRCGSGHWAHKLYTSITACIEGFCDVKKGVGNAIKSTNFISKFCTLKSVIKLKHFLLCHSLFLEKFEFDYTFQGAKFANKICTFYSIFYTLFYITKFFYAGCVYNCQTHPHFWQKLKEPLMPSLLVSSHQLQHAVGL